MSHLKAVGCAAGMMAARDADHVAVGHRHGFIKQSVIGINSLNAKTRGRIEPVIAGFLKISDAREVVFVVAVAGIGRPMPCRGKDFRDQKAVTIVLVFHCDIVDVTRVGPLAALGERDPVRADTASGVPAFTGSGADGDCAIGLRGGGPLTVVG